MPHESDILASNFPSQLADELLLAYRRTIYRVCAQPEFDFRIGQYSTDMALAHATRHITSSAFLTACNPQSCQLPPNENALRMADAQRSLLSAGLACVAALAIDPDGLWPAEESLWVPGITFEQAICFAARFDQNAFVWFAEDAKAHLALMR
jgi:hypothetical protein